VTGSGDIPAKRRSSHGQRTLPGEYFQSAGIWRQENERIFGRSWLLAGHVSELAGNGDYFLHEAGNGSVIVLRDGAGRIRAHHNFCRHRGTRLCHESRGRLGAALQCPYHAWTYALDGALKGAPHMQEVAGFDKAA
jgi:phenylpropionate dioxygenase-like ring-hydroxylating dioxygenase large terminal subunit